MCLDVSGENSGINDILKYVIHLVDAFIQSNLQIRMYIYILSY